MNQEQRNAFYYKVQSEESTDGKAPKRKGSQDQSSPNKKASLSIDANEAKRGDVPNKPKSKKTALSFFSSEIGAEIRKQSPHLSTAEVNKEVHLKWENLTEQGKQKYKEMAYKDQVRYETEMSNYQALTSKASSSATKKPKAKKSAFNFFSIEKGAELKQKTPNLKQSDVVKEVTDLWQNLEDEAKQKYNNMALKDQARFEEEMKEYQPAFSQPQFQAVKDPNKPKKGRNSFMFFNAEISIEIRKNNPTWKTGEIAKETGNRWQKLTEEEKQKYTDMAEKDKCRHEEEMKGYQAPPPIMVPMKAVKDPNRPKGKKSAYTCFVTEIGAQLRSENPKLSAAEVSKELAKRWKEVDEKTRQKYEEMADADKGRYEAQMKDYVPPPPQPIGKKLKKQKDPNKPKGRIGSYMFFAAELRPQMRKENPEMSITDAAKVIGNRWKELDEEKRKKYEELAENDKKRYEQEMELFNQGKFVRTPTHNEEAAIHDSEESTDLTETNHTE
jgi:hypothetical protein